MSEPNVPASSPDSHYEQLAARLAQLEATNTALQTSNEELRAQNARILSHIQTSTSTDDADSEVQVLEEEEEKERQRHTVRHSRQSLQNVYQNNSNNSHSTVMGGGLSSPFAPPRVVPARTELEQERRASHGMPTLFSTAGPVPVHPVSDTLQPGAIPVVNKGRYSPYDQASQAMSRIDKFYGDKKHDKVDVYTFVRSVDFQLSRYMQGQVHGRLELVISCTAGPAQMWLMNKREDVLQLIRLKHITPEMAEWDEMKNLFIEMMDGGQTQRLYEAKLDELKVGRGQGNDEVMKFITTFREYATRAYPLDKYPDTRSRSRVLGKTFKERILASDMGVWKEMMRMMPTPQTLEEWELAFTQAWTTEQTVREQQRKRFGENTGGAGRNKGVFTSQPSSQSVSRMQVEGETGTENEGEESEEGLNVVAARGTSNKKNEGPKKGRNKHIDGKMAAQLMRLGRCLLCYQGGHFARECPTPSSRPPSEKELKEKADQ